jgi:predicted transcriptional regulator
MYEVKNRYTGEVLLRLHKPSLQDRYLGPLIPKDLRQADFTGLNLRGAQLTGRDLSEAKFDDADLTGAQYDMFTLWPEGFDPEARGAVRVPADLHGLNRSGADLAGLDLRDGNFLGTNLAGADLSGSDLRNAVMRGADLFGANLTNANLEGADLHAVKADEGTVWPAGFEPPEWLGMGPGALKEKKRREEAERNLEELVAFLKALADKSRLQTLGILADGEHTVEEIAAALGLKEPTVSHHLNRLKEQDLVRMRAEGTVHLYSLKAARLRERLEELSSEAFRGTARDLDRGRYDRRVLKAFMEEGKLTAIPMQPKKRRVILNRLVEEFAPGARYPEKQVNEILSRFHPDYATLRREMVDERLMARERGVYWRLPLSG